MSLPDWIDPDEVAAEVRTQTAGLSERQISDIAFRIARKKRVEFAQNLDSFGFETVFSHRSNVDFLDGLKALGYVVHLYFVCTEDPEINVGRVRNRVQSGGHSVPEDKIRDRYYRSLALLTQSVRRYDRIVFFDNSFADQPGQAVGEILNAVESKLTLNPRPYLPDWLISSGVEGFRRRHEIVGPAAERASLRDDPLLRRAFLQTFAV